jgi:CBS domain-containing protein
MLVKDICTLDTATCGRDISVIEAAGLMREHHTGCLIVVDDPGGDCTPAGVLTDRDIVLEVLALGLDPAFTRVSQVMCTELVVAVDAEDVADAVERMRLHGVRRMPVVGRDGGLVGIVTLDDVLTLHVERGIALAGIVSKEQSRERRHRR